MYNNNWVSIFYFILLFLFIQIFDLISWELGSFITKNIFLIIFLSYNIFSYKKHNHHNWLLNPAVLASMMTFLLGYCITNYVYFIPGSEDEKLMNRLLGPEYLTAFNTGMNAVIIAAISMWIGYNTQAGVKFYNLILSFPLNLKKYFRSSFTPNLGVIYLLSGLAVSARLYSINLGIYGYAHSPEKLTESIGIAYTLIAISEITSLCLLVISFAYFRNRKNFSYKFTFYLLLITEIGFGVLSGMKSLVVMPILLAFITYYLVNNKIHKGFIVTAFIFLVIAYLIIEPYRQIRMKDLNFQSNPAYIIDTMIDAYFLNKQRQVVYGTDNPVTSIISRNAYLLAVTKSIQYAEEQGLGENDPDFLEKIYTLPLQAFVPRLVWKNKPLEDFSQWYSANVWGSAATTSVAMTPMGFLYFAGGYLFIVLGFFLIGILQKTLWQFYLAGGGQLLVFLAMLSTVVLIDSAFNGMIVYWMRYIPIFIFLQSLILKQVKPGWQTNSVYARMPQRL